LCLVHTVDRAAGAIPQGQGLDLDLVLMQHPQGHLDPKTLAVGAVVLGYAHGGDCQEALIADRVVVAEEEVEICHSVHNVGQKRS
jgi:hypothetical protein